MSDKALTHSRLTTGNQHEFYDVSSQERVLMLTPLFWKDDFLAAGSVAIPAAGSPSNGADWVKKLVGAGTPTVAGVANAGAGVMQCALDATSEKQEGTLYWNDQKNLDVTKSLVFEARAKLSVLPSAAGVQTVLGLSASWIDGPDNAAEYIEFGATANGAILLRSQDGTTQNSVASGVTVLATDWHVYRFDCSDVTDIKFFIDGIQVSASGAIGFAATGANSILQPYASVYKPSGAGVATLQVDYMKVWSQR